MDIKVTQDRSGNHTVRLDYTNQDNDAIFKAWRKEIGTDLETTRHIIESEATPVIWPGERDYIWLDKR